MSTWLSHPTIADFPEIIATPESWVGDVIEELRTLKDLCTTLDPLSSEAGDALLSLTDHLRSPTVEESIETVVASRLQELSSRWKTADDGQERQRTLQLSDGTSQFDDDTKNTRKRRQGAFRVSGLSEVPQSVSWGAPQMILRQRLETRLESFKLTFDFDDYRYKRLYVSVNSVQQAHVRARRRLEAGRVQHTDHSATPPSLPTEITGAVTSSNREAQCASQAASEEESPTTLMQDEQTTQHFSADQIQDHPVTSALALRSSLTLLQDTDVIITVSFYHPVRGLKIAEFDVLGSQTLALLKDAFVCEEDFSFYAKDCLWSCFFINGVFYSDGRHPNVPDFSKRLAEHLIKYAPGRVNEHDCHRNMELTTFGRLPIHFNRRACYLHRGDCEHRMTLTSMRRFDPRFDCPYVEGYPLRVFQPAAKISLCQTCLVNVAGKIVFNSSRLPQNPMLLCTDCYSRFFETKTGALVTDEDFVACDFHPVS